MALQRLAVKNDPDDANEADGGPAHEADEDGSEVVRGQRPEKCGRRDGGRGGG